MEDKIKDMVCEKCQSKRLIPFNDTIGCYDCGHYQKSKKVVIIEDKLSEIFEKNSYGYSEYDKDAIIKELILFIGINQREQLINFCDKVIWIDKRVHIHTERIDKFLNEGK